nr:hypothetical protein [Tanacetum cinerariifolium]
MSNQSEDIQVSIDEGPFKMGRCRYKIDLGIGAPYLGPEPDRVVADLSQPKKDRLRADIRVTNILLQGSKLIKDDCQSQLYDEFEHFGKQKGGQTITFDDDVDEGPVQDMAQNEDNNILADQFDTFDYDLDDVNESHEEHEMQKDVPPNDVVDSDTEFTSNSNLISYEQVAIGYKNPFSLSKAKQVQPALYCGQEIVMLNHACVLVHDFKDTLEIAETARKQIIEKMKDLEYVKKKIFWSDDLLKVKAKTLKEEAKSIKPITAMTVYPPNTLAKLVSKVLRTKSQALDSQNKDLIVKGNALQDLNERFRAENEKVKQHYKELYDFIKLTRAKIIEKTTSLLDEIKNLKAQLKGNVTPQPVRVEVLQI